jgi:drug/metabolite transporter (DMT)-like permease
MRGKTWLYFAVVTTLFWGVWGALIEIPEKAGFPATLGYSVWALTMVPCALVALKIVNWQLEYDARSVLYGCVVGLLGAGGQLILFQALRIGPAYLVFPIISLSPVVTIVMSFVLLRERASKISWIGITLAILAVPFLSYQSPENAAAGGALWLLLALLVFVAWGTQAYVIKFANKSMKAESIFFYMMLTAVLLIPLAIIMTDFSLPINYGFKGPYLAALIQVLNSIGALCLVYAFRHGKAIIVSPLTNAVAPVITVIISLLIYRTVPDKVVAVGMIMAVCATFLMAMEPDDEGKASEA